MNELNTFITDKIARIVTDVNDGAENPLIAIAIFKTIQNDLKEAIDEIEGYAISEAMKYDKTFELEGYKFQWKEGSRRYDFSGCKSWAEQKEKLSELEKSLKAAFAASQRFGQIASTETGEQIELPVCNISKPSISLIKTNLYEQK